MPTCCPVDFSGHADRLHRACQTSDADCARLAALRRTSNSAGIADESAEVLDFEELGFEKLVLCHLEYPSEFFCSLSGVIIS